MRHDPLLLLWTIKCPATEDCHRLQQWLPSQLTPGAVLLEEVRAIPGGVETCHRESHRLGDYFESIQVLPSAAETPWSFRLLFRRRATA
jgi:hypothetical protein